MISVAAQDLETKVSYYLQFVKKGERVLITEHDTAVAEIVLPVQKKDISIVEQEFLNLQNQGEMILAKTKVSYTKPPVHYDNVNWIDAYNEIRSDRL